MLTGPTYLPTNPTHALVCLHGFGADGDDFANLAPVLQPMLPHLSLASFCPNGPAPTPLGQGYQWFSDAGWTFRDPKGIAATHPLLEAYLTDIHETHAIPFANIALLGFSQGAMQALYSVPRLGHPLGAFISCAGAITLADKPDPIAHTPTLMLHGMADDVLPADHTIKAAETYKSWGMEVEHHLLDNLGHGLNADALAHVSVFLNDVWKA